MAEDSSVRTKDAAGARRQGSSHRLDHGRTGLRRRFGLDHRRHPAQHRGRAPGRHPRASQGPPAQSRSRLRERRRVHEVLVPGRAKASSTRSSWSSRARFPTRSIKKEGYWAALGHRQATGQPITTNEWIDRLSPKALAVVAIGTCATYGGIHAMEGNPTGAWGCSTTSAGTGNRRPACRSCACPAVRYSPITSWRPCSTCSIRWPASRR